MLPTFAGEAALKQESPRCLWKSIFIAAVDFINKPDRDRGTARYVSRSRLRVSYKKKGESIVKLASRRAALDICVDIISSMVASDVADNHLIYFPVTGSRYLLKGRESPDQTEHDSLVVQERSEPRCFCACFWV